MGVAMRMRFICGAVLALLAGGAQGSVVGGNLDQSTLIVNGANLGGTFVALTPPAIGSTPASTVGDDNFQLPNLYAMDELQDIVLTSALDLDIGPLGGPVTLPIGTVISSHYVFANPDTAARIEGTVDFDRDILGIATSRLNLGNSDFLGALGITYLNPDARGLEIAADQAGNEDDNVFVDALDPRRLHFQVTAGAPGDYVRVITVSAEVPLPAAGWLLLTGLGGLGLVAQARRRTA